MRSQPLHILHVDMDAFFASVEQLDHPEWRGKPVLVGHAGPRGVVAAASYEARVYGCRSAQPMAVAKRMCPHAIVAPGRFSRYREVSNLVFEIFHRFTPVVQPVSVDEAFLDISGTERLFGDAVRIAAAIKKAIVKEARVTASVGVSFNKFLAKLASDMHKPDGLTVIGREDVERVLPPMPVGRIWGIGPKTAARLEGIGVKTIADLRRLPADVLKHRLGDDAEHYLQLAHGIDDRVVTTDRQAKSIGQEQTFEQDVVDQQLLHDTLLEQAEHIAARLRRAQLRAKHVMVKIRFGDFQTITRRCTLLDAADTTPPLFAAAQNLFHEWAGKEFSPVRLLGLAASGMTGAAEQMELFADPTTARDRRLEQTIDAINARFGKSTVHRGHRKED